MTNGGASTGKERIGFILPSVAVTAAGQAVCAVCGHGLGTAAGSWKPGAICREVPLAEAGGPAYDTGFPGVVLRHFYCPGCATLLDTETATPGDPALTDRIGHAG